MKKHTINPLVVSVALSLACSGARANELYWTGATDNIWSKAANWYNTYTSDIAKSFPGAPNQYDHNAHFDQTLADGKSAILQRTVVFDLAEEMRGSVYVYDGTLADPIVFSAIGDYGLSVTNSAKTFQIGKDGQAGWLKMQGGTFFSNPALKIDNGGWIVDGGASFSTTNHITIGGVASCNATAIFNDGAIALTKFGKQNCNFIIGKASGAVGIVTNVNASINVGNSVLLGDAASSGAHYVQLNGQLNINNRLTIGSNSSSTDNVFELIGGEVDLGQLFLLDKASFLLKGGSVSFTSIGFTSGSGSKENKFIFDGGAYITKQSQNYAPFPADNFNRLKVGAKGGTIDTATYFITIAHNFESDVENGVDGGMKYVGGGSAIITGAIGYTGPTTVEFGTRVTIADRANIFGEGKGGLRCSLPNPKPEGNEYITVLTTTGEDFTASDLTKCAAAEGAGGISFRISGDGKSIMAKRSNGLIISFH